MRFSLITPVYNMQNFVEPFLESVSHQTFRDYEIIIVDYGSTDNTLHILRQKKTENMRLIETQMEFITPSNGTNIGLEKAQGEFILFPDMDDWLELNALECLDKNLKNSQAQTMIFQCVEELPYSPFPRNRIYPFASGTYHAPFDSSFFISYKDILAGACWRKCYSHSLIEKHNIRFNNTVNIGTDILFDLDYFTHAQHFTIIKDVLYHYRINPKSMVRRYHDNLLDMYMNQYHIANNVFRSWGILNQDNMHIRQTKILKNSLTCLKNAVHPLCKESLKQIQRIINHSEIRTAIRNVTRHGCPSFTWQGILMLMLIRLKFSAVIMFLLRMERFIRLWRLKS